jgi:CRISPR-associated protein Cst1
MAIYAKLMGNPFVDAGVSAICEWLGERTQPHDITISDLKQTVSDIAPILQTNAGWGNLHSIFPNSVLTNPSFNRRDRVALFQELCGNYIDTLEELGLAGDCIGCGRRDANCFLKRENVPLTGSGTLRNFFPTFAEGVGYCAACALAIQLSPLVLVASAGKFLMLHSNSWRALRGWARICIEDIRQQAIRREISGCYNRGYSNSRNGLFYMASEMIRYEETRFDENIILQIYYFSNYGQGPELEIFHLPAPVFRFLRYAYQNEFRRAWQQIVRSGYRRVRWNKVESEDDYKNHSNLVYEFLLQSRSILQFFINRPARKARSNWEFLSLYLKEVRNMDESRLNAIKQVGDFIAESIRKSERDRRLRQLESAGSYGECRNILRFVIRDRIQQGEDAPLFSLDDYVAHLFPESLNQATFWRETRDLLVFRIYETLHDWLVTTGFTDDIDDETEQSTDKLQEDN